MEIPALGLLVVRPGRFLHAGKHHALVGVGGRFFDQTYQSRYLRIRIAARCLKPAMLVGGVIDDEVDDHADAALLGSRG